jgi:hypothetical protein
MLRNFTIFEIFCPNLRFLLKNHEHQLFIDESRFNLFQNVRYVNSTFQIDEGEFLKTEIGSKFDKLFTAGSGG